MTTRQPVKSEHAKKFDCKELDKTSIQQTFILKANRVEEGEAIDRPVHRVSCHRQHAF
jgi:hypothetical protein